MRIHPVCPSVPHYSNTLPEHYAGTEVTWTNGIDWVLPGHDACISRMQSSHNDIFLFGGHIDVTYSECRALFNRLAFPDSKAFWCFKSRSCNKYSEQPLVTKLKLLQACKEFPEQFVMVETCRAQEIAFDATAAEGCAITRKLYPLWHAQSQVAWNGVHKTFTKIK